MSRPPLILPLLVAGTFFMEMLDGTVIATAMPQMGGSFGVGPADLSIGMTAYMLTLAVFIPVSGWIADRFGARSVFALAIVIFTVASLGCGLAPTLGSFVAARIVQAIGGALMTPVGRMVVLRATPKEHLVRAIGTITWPGLVATIIGPPVGGLITTYASWRWIFWLNLPLGLVALLLVLRLVPNARGVARPFDRMGFVLSGLALAGLMEGLDELGRPGADGRVALLMLAVSAALGWAAIRHARRHPHPLLDPTPAGIPTMAAFVYSGTLFRIAFNTMPYLVPLLLQVGFGMSAFAAGGLILVGALADVAMKTVTTRLIHRFGFRRLMVGNTVAGAVVLAGFALLSRPGQDWAVMALLAGYGLTRSLQFTAMSTIAFADIPPALSGAASTLASMLMQLSIGMGVGFGAVVLHGVIWLRGGDAAAPAIGDFQLCFLAAGLLALLTVIGNWRLAPDAGASISHYRRRRN